MTTRAIPPDRVFLSCNPGSEIDRPEFTDLLISYAHAMWSWSRVEDKLFLIFAHAVEPTTNNHSKALRAAFFSIVTAKARLDMIHSVARAMWEGKAHWESWMTIYDECTSQLRTRGRLAHLVGYGFHDEKQGKPKRFIAVLGEPTYHPSSPRRHADLRRAEFGPDKLSRLASDWRNLSDRLGVFCLLAAEQAKPDASAAHSDQLIQILKTTSGSAGRHASKRLPQSRKS